MALSGWDADKKIQLTIAAADIDSALTDLSALLDIGVSSGKTNHDSSEVTDDLVPTETLLNPDDKNSGFTLSANRTVATFIGSSIWRSLRCAGGFSTGKWYFEFEYTDYIAHAMFGVAGSGAALTSHIGASSVGWAYNGASGDKFSNNSSSAYGDSITSDGDIVGVAIDMGAGKIWFSLNGVWQNSGDPAAGTGEAFSNLTGTVYPALSAYSNGTIITIKFSWPELSYTPPTGFALITDDGSRKIAVEIGNTGNQCHVEPESWTNLPDNSPVYPSPIDATTVKTDSSYSSTSYPHFAIDPNLPTIGGSASTGWMSAAGTSTTDHRINIDYTTSFVAKRLCLENYHIGTGSYLTRGVKNFKVYGTNSATAFAETDPAVLTDLTLIGTFLADQHVASDTSDPQYFTLTNSTSYRYYVFIGLDTHGDIYMGLRCIEFQQTVDSVLPVHVVIPSVSDSVDTALNFYYDINHADNTDYVGKIGDNITNAVFITHAAQDPSGFAPQILDSTDNGADGTTYGSMVAGDLVDMLFGKGLELNGSSQYISHAYKSVHDITDVLTVVAVFRPSVLMDSTLSANEPIIYRGSNSYSLEINSDGKLQLTTTAGTMQSTKNSFSADTEYLAIVTFNATGLVGRMFIYDLDAGTGGEETLSVDSLATMSGNTNNLLIGSDGTNYFTGAIGFIGVHNEVWSADKISATSLSLTDDLITFGAAVTTTTLRAILDMEYGDLMAANRAYSDLIYSLLLDHRTYTDMIYGLRLGAHVDIKYGDCPVLRHHIDMWYSDCPLLRRALVMAYGDLLMHRQSIDMPYSMPKVLVAAMEMRYSIAEKEVRAYTDMSYDLLVNNPLRAALVMPYLIQGDGLVRDVGADFTIAGRAVNTNHISIEPDLTHYVIPLEAHLTREADYIEVVEAEEIVAIVDGTTFNLIVDDKRTSRSERGTITWIVEGMSPAVKLSFDYSGHLLRSFDAGSAFGIINELIGEVDADLLPVDYQVDDFPMVGLYANDEDRITIIGKILDTVDAKLQSNPDGSLRVIYEEPDDWQTREPDYYISSERNFVSQDDTTIKNPGYNKFLVGNQISSDDRLWPEERDVSGHVREVMGFQTPWDASKVLSLEHSGGAWVSMPEYMGVVEEIYPPAGEDPEQVEFVAGFANTSRPVYDTKLSDGSSVPFQIQWIREQLGAVSFAEDGRLEAELKDGRTDGYSLAEVRYLTRFHLWRVRDQLDESVQFLIVEAD